MSWGGSKLLAVAASFNVIWAALLLSAAATILSGADLYPFSYYSVDYTVGFVRRGLAGELVGLFPEDQYFLALRILRWVSSVAYIASLCAVMWTVATRWGRSERRTLLALLIPVLPFGLAFALFSARPDLFGAALFVAFAVTLTRVTRPRSVIIASAAYGFVIAVVALMHEAVPLAFALGPLLAIVVLPSQLSAGAKRLSVLLAIVPGLLSALIAGLHSERGDSPTLCALIPHRMVENPYAINGGEGLRDFLTGANRPYTDYHDWMCRIILPLWDWSPQQAMGYVYGLGIGPLTASAIFGAAILAITVVIIRYASNVPFRRFVAAVSGWYWWAAAALALTIPIFLTAFDWTRWWVAITLNVAVVYMLFAASQPEMEQRPKRRTLVRCLIAGLALAILPIGIIPGLAAQPPI